MLYHLLKSQSNWSYIKNLFNTEEKFPNK